MQLAEHNLLIGGEPGSGKSVILSSVVAAAALDPSTTLTLFDGKQVELSIWKDAADEFVGPDLEHAAVVIERLQQIMDFRYQVLLALGSESSNPAIPRDFTLSAHFAESVSGSGVFVHSVSEWRSDRRPSFFNP